MGVSTQFENILKKYEVHKIQSYKVIQLLKGNYVFNDLGKNKYDERCRAIEDCGTFLKFAKTQQEGETVYRLRASNFCRQRVCPMCQFRKSEKMFAEMIQGIKQIEDKYRFLHVVLTIPNATYDYELVEGVKILYKGFSRLMMYKEIERAFKGVLRCLEISFNYDNNTFHPHLHCLIAVNKSYFNDTRVYVKYEKLRELWTEAVRVTVRNRGPEAAFADTQHLLQVNIRACKLGDYEGVAEVCKYCLKPLELDKAENEQQNIKILLVLFHVLKGTRFIQKYGIFRSDIFKNIGDDILEEETAAERTKSFLWNASARAYEEGE